VSETHSEFVPPAPVGGLLPDPDATRTLGTLLAQQLVPGLVVALIGELGAGKTCLAKATIASLSSVAEDDVLSPTYVLVVEYEGRVDVTHIDAYRLSGAAAFMDLGLELGTCATLIEWADRILEALPSDRLTVELEHVPEGRKLTLTAGGPKSAKALTALHVAADTTPLELKS
jgi:tRNA threonylcarbamoyl adenosine modification protein YjeE